MTHPSPSAPVFIAEDRTVLTGEAATAMLATKNDAAAVDPARGITRAGRHRWLEAQRYEHKTWMTDFRSASDDRNQTHAQHFDGYDALRARSFARAIELGCGPFTNIRLIGRAAAIRSLELLDPLIDSYLKHPHCAYGSGAITLGPAAVTPTLHACAIEDFEPAAPYDLIVMINVLEHCFDAEAIFEKILAMSAPGSVFAFHDRYYTAATLADTLRA
jgi:SAM-dependent methyltransferase